MKLNLKHYSALAAAFVAAKSEVDAQIVYTNIKDKDLYVGDSYHLDLNNDGKTDFLIEFFHSSTRKTNSFRQSNDLYIFPYSNNEVQIENSSHFLNTPVLLCGDSVNSKAIWKEGLHGLGRVSYVKWCSHSYCTNPLYSSGSLGDWTRVSDGYLGLKLVEKTDTLYGWVRMDVDLHGHICIVKDFAYNKTNNEPINVGQVNCEDLKTVLPEKLSLCNDACSNLELSSPSCLSYQWYYNGKPIYGAVENDLDVCDSGSYFLTISNSQGCTDTSTVVHAIDYSNPEKPIISRSGDTLISSPADHYQWLNDSFPIFGQASQKFTPEYNSDLFQVEITDSNTCTSLSDSYIFGSCNLFDKHVYAIDVDSRTDTFRICKNSSLDLEIHVENISYQWVKNGVDIPGATQSAYSVNKAGNYYCAMSGYGITCFSSTAVVTVDPTIPAVPIISRSNDTLICTQAPIYQWTEYQQNISGATQQKFVPTQNGYTYRVQVTDTDNCSNISSDYTFGSCKFFDRSLDANDKINDSIIACGADADISTDDKGFNAYQWVWDDSIIQNSTNSYYLASKDGLYYCELTAYNITCNSDSLFLYFNHTPTVTLKGDTLTASQSPNYQWILNSFPIAGATNQEYIPDTSGAYWDITLCNDGSYLASNVITVVLTSSQNLAQNKTPVLSWINRKLIQIQFLNSGFLQGKIKIINALGQTVREISIESNEVQIPFTENENGWFVLEIEKDEHRYFSPVVIF